MFATIFSNFWKLQQAQEYSSSDYYYYISYLEKLQPYYNEICPNFHLTLKISLSSTVAIKKFRYPAHVKNIALF